MSIKKILTLLIALMSFVAVEAQEHSITIDESSFVPESGLPLDKIGTDHSNRECARIKMRINRMTAAEIDQISVHEITGNVEVMECVVSAEGNGLIIELTAKERTRLYITHPKYGYSNEVSLDLVGGKEYKLSAQLNIVHSIAVSSNTKGAEVYVDDKYQGCIGDDYTLTVKDVIPGTHELMVKSGISIDKQQIVVNEDSIYFRVNLNTETTKSQYVVFEVSPKDAAIIIENKSYVPDDEGYVEICLQNGSYSYQVSAYGYHEESGSFIVSGNKVKEKVALKPAHGWVSVESSSMLQDANIYIDGVFIGKAPIKSNKLLSGKHTIKIIKNLYEPYTDNIIIEDNQTLKYRPTLTANFATVTVTTAQGAEIYINDKYKGTTTWTGDLETGIYTFEARKTNHETTIIQHEIKAQPQKQKITLDDPKPIMGYLKLTSSPTMATVMVDGKAFGETPLLEELLIGTHTVTVSKKGYILEQKQFRIKEGETTILPITLQEDIEPASLSISSSPQKANVYIDGDYVGTTPLYNYNVERGKHKIKVTSSGYSSKTEEITVNGGESRPLYYSLETSFGKKTKNAVSNAFDSVVDTVDDACDAVGDAFGAIGDGIVDAVDTILDSDSFNIGPSIGFGFDISDLDLGSGYSDYYGGGYYGGYGGYYDYYYSAKNSTTRSSSDDSDGEVGGEFSIGLLWRLWGYDTLFNVHTGVQYTFASERTFLSIPAVVNLNLYDDYWDYAMYLGLGTDFSFVHDNSNSDYYSGDTYQGLQCPFIFQYGIGARHHDVCFYIKAYFENDSVYMGMRYSYLF